MATKKKTIAPIGGTGNELADLLINARREELGKGEVAGKQVHNCVGGDVVELTNKETKSTCWGVVGTPKSIMYIDEDGAKQTKKLCSITPKYGVKFWR